jgi:hypothetical protein
MEIAPHRQPVFAVPYQHRGVNQKFCQSNVLIGWYEPGTSVTE